MNQASLNRPKMFAVFNHGTTSGKLTKFFTGCYAYHVGFIVPESGMIYDMNLLFRQIPIGTHYTEDNMVIFDMPEDCTLTEQDLIDEVLQGVERLCTGSMLQNLYGFLDYLLFSVKGLYHLFGRSTPNMGGEICSEKMIDLMVRFGWKSNPFKDVPSPCDMVKYFAIQE